MKKLLYVVAASLLLQACGGGGSGVAQEPVATTPEPPVDPGQPPAACSIADQRQSLQAFMGDQYLWYTQLGVPNAGASSMDAYFQSMLYRPTDRFSFTQSTTSYDQTFTTGYRIGYGYSLVWADDAHSALRVRSIDPESPAQAAGLKRGDIVVAIDGLSPAQVVAGALPAVTEVGVSRTFRLRDAGGATHDIVVRSENFPINPIAATATFDTTRAGQPVKVGYIAYNQFVGYSLWALALALQGFADAGVGEMIVDLRYNGGGSVATSRDLASLISGSRTEGKTFATLKFNDKQSAQNVDYAFKTAEERFTRPIEGLARVFVITSGGTASASELVINGLKPFMGVVLVGETTYGKPFGFAPRSYCGTTYNAVQFETVNSLGVGGYTAGFTPDCQVADDLDHQLGDAAEARTRAALQYVATGACSTQAPLSARITAPLQRGADAFGEVVPPQMFRD